MKIRYYSVRAGNGYWQPTPKMRRLGFEPIPCGPDGPTAWRIAEEANRRWQAVRGGADAKAVTPQESETLADRLGHVYVIFSGDRVKIGFSRKPFARIGDLMTGFAAPPRMVIVFRGRPRDEKALHARFAAHRASGEWFRLTAALQREIMRLSTFETLSEALRQGTKPEQSLNEFRQGRSRSDNVENVDFSSH